MGIFDKLRGEFIDIIEWLDDSRDTIVYRFPRYENEIKMGAKLVCRESQTAVFVNEGKIADVFAPGTYTLQTQNLPILSTIKGWKYGFNSPWKAEVYFVNTRQFTDLKWGTQNPIIVRDPEFGPVRLRAFGSFTMRVVDPGAFLKELVGTDPLFKTDEVTGFLRQIILSKLPTLLGTANISVLDMAAHQEEAGKRLTGQLSAELKLQGVEIPRFVIENVSLPPEVEQALDKRSQMGVLGNLDKYTQFQSANAIEQAAKNPGGAGEGMGMGIGMAMGQRMAQSMGGATTPAQGPSGPPPLPQSAQYYVGLDGRQQGPFDHNGLRTLANSGQLKATTLIWSQGMANWAQAGSVAEVAALIPHGPPPLPPS